MEMVRKMEQQRRKKKAQQQALHRARVKAREEAEMEEMLNFKPW